MLVNLLRLLGSIVKQKRQCSLDTQPSHVILLLSPNHSILGSDGLYGESQIKSLLKLYSTNGIQKIGSMYFLSFFLLFTS
jgi:3-oxoacyl-ACP reductase-like protein